MSQAPPQAPGLDKTFGAALCGLLVATFLYGITSLQTYVYLRTFPKDGPRLKSLVWSLWLAKVIDTIHVACAGHTVYWYVITNYFNPPALDHVVWSLSLSLGLNVVIAFIVQCWFTKRVWSLGRSKAFTTTVVILVLAHFAFGITTMIEMFMKQKFSRLPEIKLFPVTPFGITAIGSDVAIAAALCFYLHNIRTGLSSTEGLIDTLMIYAIERCLLTSLFAIIEIICFVSLPNTLVYLAIDLFMGKLYANSLLATLNSRTSFRGRGNDDEIHSSHAARDRRTASRPRRNPVSIEFTPEHATSRSSNPGIDSLSYGGASAPHMATSDKVEAYKPEVDHII